MTETPPETAEMPDAHSWHVPRLVLAWVAAAAMGTLVTLLTSPTDRFSWLVLAVGVATLITFALQLGTAQREGFISRVSFSVAGSVVIIAIIDVIGLLL
ncbi:hypothetical protein [Leucobacter sp. NPDC077196]|uniref:hypothetical protein n=1 Tax=Leucobacter sp. NPDC077196 TaxID=3154959 RepID=UPI003422CA4E